MDGEKLHPDSTKNEWLWVFRLPRSEDIPAWTLDEVAFPHSKMMCNLGIFLDLHLLLDEQVATVVRQAFAQLHVVLIAPFLEQVPFR